MKINILMALCLLGLLSACGGWGPETAFDGNKQEPVIAPTETEVVEEQRASSAYCKPDDAGNYVEQVTAFGESGRKENFYASRGGGCILRPIRDVWGAMHNSKTWAWQDSDLDYFKAIEDKGAALSFEAKYSAGPFFHREDWIMQYFHSLTEGTFREPQKVIANFQKVKGTIFIRRWRGVIELRALTPTVTGFAMRVELDATNTDINNCYRGITDTLSNLRNQLPDYSYLDRYINLNHL